MSIKLIDENKIMTKLSHTEPVFGEDGTKERYRYMQWMADTNAIKELKPERAIPIPDGATNGDMILTTFPEIGFYETVYVCGIAYVRVEFKGLSDIEVFNLEWWNTPYRER